MRKLFLIALFLAPLVSYSQRKCSCSVDSEIAESISCDTIHLNNKASLYYQFTCDSIWLTYQKPNGKKLVIYSADTDMYQYNYRLGYQFAKEYKKSLLFRSGCPANGPCNFVLISKSTGKQIRELGELIYDHDTRKFYDFLVYFSNENELAIDFIDSGKKFSLPINSKYLPDERIPEYSFGKVTYKNGMLTLYPSDTKYDKRSAGKISFDIGKLRNSLKRPIAKKST